MTDKTSPAAAWTAQWVEPVQRSTTVERWSLMDWIQGAGPGDPPDERLRPAQLLRQEFEVGPGLVRATLRATARGIYTAWANGDRVGDEVLAPGYDSYQHRISFQTYDVTESLRPGSNALGFALADGWWAGRIGLTGSSAQFGDRTSMIWQLDLEYEDGTTGRVISGEGVTSAPGPWRYADLFVGEYYDAGAVQAGWSEPEFTGQGWIPASVVGDDVAVLVPFSGEPVRRVLEVSPVSLSQSTEGIVVDFGQVLVGRLRLCLRGLARGTEVLLEHTETLDADGRWFQNIVGINKEQTDVYIAGGAPVERYEPEFTFHGFRYARIRGLETLDPSDITAVVISSDLAQTGSFECSDARLNRLHENVVWSQRGNFLAVPTDCPQRERAGWTGDLLAFTAAATNNADVRAFLARWLDNLRADQLADGRIPIFSPRSPFDAEAAATGQGFGSIVAAAGWSDAIAFVPWVLYERYGDPGILRDNFEAMLRWIAYQARTAEAELPASVRDVSPESQARHALLYNTGEHFGDWLTPSTMEGKPTHEAIGIAPALTSEYIAPMFQAQTLTLAARAARVLGRPEAAELEARAAAVRAAFAAEYVDADGDLPVRLQGLYVLALAFDMVPESLRSPAAARLVELVRERGDRLDTGFLSTPHMLDVLWDHGYPEVARALLRQSEMPSWLYQVDHGATTIWETWDAVAPDGTIRPMSFNHYAPGAVDDWLYRRVAGIRSSSPGFRTAVIEPDFDAGPTYARAHVGTPYGRLAVEWERAGETASVTADVPPGVSARLVAGGETLALATGRSTHAVSLREA